MFSVTTDGFAKIVHFVRHRLVDRFAGAFHVLADRFGDVIHRKHVHDLLRAAGCPLGATTSCAPHGSARHLLGLASERARGALAASAKEHRDAGAGHETEQRCGQQVVLVALTFGGAVLSV